MDARAAESKIGNRLDIWLQRERESGRFYDRLLVIAALFLVAIMAVSFILLRQTSEPDSLLSPPFIALLLIANLIPAIAIMVLFSRRIAMARAEEGGLGSGRLHTRLVALFSVIAAAPTVLVAIFASLLFQSGIEFWFSDRARGMLENTVQVARASYQQEADRVSRETVAMSTDLSGYLGQLPVDSPQFIDLFGRQVLIRNLSESIIVNVGADGIPRSLVLINPYDRPLEKIVTKERIAQLKGGASVSINSPDRVGALTKLDFGPSTYLYAARVFDPQFRQQIDRANGVLQDYQTLLARSRANQLRFNAALLLGALIIVAFAILAALKIADRMVRPVGQLAAAAGQIEAGDFTARVQVGKSEDEIQMLASAFNRMTGKLEEQTGALKAANTQLDTRRAFIEAVLSSVTAGVIALDSANKILLVNRSADGLIEGTHKSVEGKKLASISPELDEFMHGEQSEANVLVAS
ncbi:MAG: HAMP domain-containing protein, partial [Sphingomicrobium sp.]